MKKAKFDSTYALDAGVHRILERQAHETPAAVALLFGNLTVTYAELNRRSNQLARRLAKIGVAPETRVALLLDRSVEMILAVLGILKAGGAYVPINLEYPPERRDYIIKSSGAKILITQESLMAGLGSAADLDCRTFAIEHELNGLASEQEDELNVEVAPENLMYVIYTSGSTGRPKGVGVTHRVIANLIQYQIAHSTPLLKPRVLQYAPLSFDVSIQEIFTAWALGGTLVLISDETRRDPNALRRLLAEQQVEVLFMPFVAFNQLIEGTRRDDTDLRMLREVLVAGEQLQVSEHTRSFFSALGSCTLRNQYGPSESHVVTEYALPDRPAEWVTLPPIGRPISNAQIYILTPDGDPASVDTIGEIYIGGDPLARGYINQPALTAERFVPDHMGHVSGRRLYRTGDLGRLNAAGHIEFLGRADHQVKIRGYRIELGEIETLLRERKGIQDSVVLPREVSKGRLQLQAYVVGQSHQSSSELRAYLAQHLPDYMIPHSFTFLEQLPLTSGGKVDRSRLPLPSEAQAKPAPLPSQQSPVGEIMSGIWTELFGASVNPSSDFFQMGGDSLLATQLIARVRSVFGVELSMKALFASSTLSAIGEWVEDAATNGRRTAPPPIARASGSGDRPLSYSQEQLWFLSHLDGAIPLYNVPETLYLSGTLDTQSLEGAFNEIVRRHEGLRTHYDAGERGPVQTVESPMPIAIATIDLSHLSGLERAVALQNRIYEEGTRSFDFERGPLYRTALIRLAQQEHVLVITIHHIVSDGWSLNVLLRELETLYNALTSGQASPLRELEVQPSDYAMWEREWLSDTTLSAQLQYWTTHLAGIPALFPFPSDRPRPAVQSFKGAKSRFRIPQSLTRAIRELSNATSVTLAITLLTTFKVLLHRYSHACDIVVGMPVARRGQKQLENMIGLFINTIVLRTNLAGDPTYKQLLHMVRDTTLDAYAHQDVPFETLLAALNPERSLSYNPLFQLAFVMNIPMHTPQLQGLATRVVEPDLGVSKFDLTLAFEEADDYLIGHVEYSSDLFDEETIERFIQHYQTTLCHALENPELRISQLALLGQEERRQIVTQWNDTKRTYPRESTIHQVFEERVALDPNRIAVVTNSEQISYGAFDRQAGLIANEITAAGVESGSTVAVCMNRSATAVASFLGVLKMGGTYVPLDTAHPLPHLQWLIKDSRVSCILADLDAPDSLTTLGLPVLRFDGRGTLSTHSSDRRGPFARARHARCSPESLAYVMYTSGSTGRPKGVAITHRNVLRLVLNNDFSEVTPVDVFLQIAPLPFDASTWEIWTPLLNGAKLVIPPAGPFSFEDLAELIARNGVSTIFVTSALLHGIVDEALHILGPLKQLLAGGEITSPVHVKRLLDSHKNLSFIAAYGPTENTTFTSCHRGLAAAEIRSTVPIGRPIANTQVYIVDENFEPTPIGVYGELLTGGDGVARGYINHPEQTAERFVPDPFGIPGSRLYRTGDMARWRSDGTMEFGGRRDGQVKIRGFRIELGEIEARLSEHPLVRQAVVLPSEEVQGSRRLIAYVVLSDELERKDSLQQYLASSLPHYMVPSKFVFMHSLPMGPTGKVDHKKLRQVELETTPDEGLVAPRNAIETKLATIWSGLLRLELVGVTNSFFDLGGHSLLITQMVSRASDAFGVKVTVRIAFENPTIASLARIIDQMRREERPSGTHQLTKLPRHGPLPLSWDQERLWLIEQFGRASALYNIPVALDLRGLLNRPALEQCLSEILRRHEILRSRMVRDGESFMQVVLESAPFPLPFVDLSHLAAPERKEAAKRLRVDEEGCRFDLEKGPLIRGALLKLDEQHHLLVLTMHHIVSDGWSLGVLFREMSALYNAFARDVDSPLPELEFQYADFVAWQKAQLQGDELSLQVAFWTKQLAGAKSTLELPMDRQRTVTRSLRGGRIKCQLSAELVTRLRALGRAERVTPFMITLAAFVTLLRRYSQTDDVVVGTTIANRNHPQSEDIIGLFVNTLVLRIDVARTATFRELLGRVREITVGAQTFGQVPLQQVSQALDLERKSSRNPLFRVMFSYNNLSIQAPALTELKVAICDPIFEFSKFDLTLTLDESGESIIASFEYDTDLFDSATIERLAKSYLTLLGDLIASPNKAIGL